MSRVAARRVEERVSIRSVTTVVIGAGHAGLAMSRCLAERVDRPCGARARRGRQLLAHRALGFAAAADAELAEPAARLRLQGDDPDGFRTMPRGRSTSSTATPRRSRRRCRPTRTVTSVRAHRRRLSGAHRPRRLALPHASCSRPAPATSPSVPALRRGACRRRSRTLTAQQYRNPGQLADGGVLVVGASATGIQIADEIHRSGPSGHAVGRRAHPRAAHLSRQGHPVVDGCGRRARRALRRRSTTSTRARSVPSLQLAGTPERTTLDLNALTGIGVRLVGRLAGIAERQGAVLRIAAQHVRAVRPQDGPAARH